MTRPSERAALSKVFVIAREFLGAECLAAVLASSLGVRIAGVAAISGVESREKELTGDVLFVLELSSLEGMGVAERLMAAGPTRRILAYGVPAELEHLVDWASIGVCGRVVQGAGLAELARAVEQAVGTRLGDAESPCSGASAADLTGREFEILGLIAQGRSNADIAEKLHLQCSTVKNHVHRILVKLEAKGRTQAAAWYRQQPSFLGRSF
jgi:DNA-binding NarL/FixJ family response regulator